MTNPQPTESSAALEQTSETPVEQAASGPSQETAQEEPAKEEPPEKKTGEPDSAMSMEALMEKHPEAYEDSFKQLRRGEFLKGVVIQINDDGVMVDVGYKTEGVIPLNQLTHQRDVNPHDIVKVGDEVNVVVKKVNDSEGMVLLSKKQADLEKAWIRVNDAFENSETLTATCTEQVKGGLIVDLGLRGFVPASHVDLRPVHDLSDYVGELLNLKVLEIDRARRKIVLSRKKALEEERARLKEKTLGELEEGQIVSGEVARLTNFGAFINLGGVDGLVHISELSWKRVKHPSDVVRVREQVEVRVLSVDRSRERISLSLKQARPDPWMLTVNKLKVGDVLDGRVTKLAKNYVFVEIAEGVEGLVPLSELSEYRVVRPSDAVKVDQPVKVKVIDIKADQRRITLSVRQGMPGGGGGGGSSHSGPMTSSSSAGGFTIGDRLPDHLKAMLTSDSGDDEPEKEAEPKEEPAKEEQESTSATS